MQEDGNAVGLFLACLKEASHHGLTHPGCPAWGTSHCCVVGLAVSMPVPAAKGGPSTQQGGEELGRHS